MDQKYLRAGLGEMEKTAFSLKPVWSTVSRIAGKLKPASSAVEHAAAPVAAPTAAATPNNKGFVSGVKRWGRYAASGEILGGAALAGGAAYGATANPNPIETY